MDIEHLLGAPIPNSLLCPEEGAQIPAFVLSHRLAGIPLVAHILTGWMIYYAILQLQGS